MDVKKILLNLRLTFKQLFTPLVNFVVNIPNIFKARLYFKINK